MGEEKPESNSHMQASVCLLVCFVAGVFWKKKHTASDHQPLHPFDNKTPSAEC